MKRDRFLSCNNDTTSCDDTGETIKQLISGKFEKVFHMSNFVEKI